MVSYSFLFTIFQDTVKYLMYFRPPWTWVGVEMVFATQKNFGEDSEEGLLNFSPELTCTLFAESSHIFQHFI